MLGKKTILCFAVIIFILSGKMSFAADISKGLIWDGSPATLEEISQKTGYDFVDTNGNYKPLYTFAAESLWENGLFLGSDGCFDLDMPITREQGVVMILRLLGKESEALKENNPCLFPDVSGWAAPYVAYAAKNGITNGVSETKFAGTSPITAVQYCTLILRVLGYQDSIDFVWNKSLDKALEIGLIGEGCHNQYTYSNLFLRDNAVMIAYNALNGDLMKTGGNLLSTITIPGKPQGSMPVTTKNSLPPEQPTISTETPNTSDDTGASVKFTHESINYIRKLDGSIDYIMIDIRLNFSSGASGKTMFKVVQSITPTYGAQNQEIINVYPSDSTILIGDNKIIGSTIIHAELRAASYVGINSIYNISVYIDGTKTLVGNYRIEMPSGGYYYFK